MAIKWITTDHGPPEKERLLLIVSAGRPPDGQLLGKSEVKIGFWTGHAFRVMDHAEQPIVTRWAKLADFLPAGIELIQPRW
jgi:hypothetical protein